MFRSSLMHAATDGKSETKTGSQDTKKSQDYSFHWLPIDGKDFAVKDDQVNTLSNLGRGSFGSVFEAFDKMLNLKVAVKQLDKA